MKVGGEEEPNLYESRMVVEQPSLSTQGRQRGSLVDVRDLLHTRHPCNETQESRRALAAIENSRQLG